MVLLLTVRAAGQRQPRQGSAAALLGAIAVRAAAALVAPAVVASKIVTRLVVGEVEPGRTLQLSQALRACRAA